MDEGLAAVVARTFGLRDVSQVTSLGEGQFSVALLVEPDLVVRFPRHATGVESLRRERKLMALIGAHVAAALPEPRRAELDRPIGEAFAAHRFVPGRTLTRMTVEQLPDEDLGEVVAQLCAFLTALTSVPTAGLGPERSPADMAEELLADSKRLLGSRLTAAQSDRAAREIAGLAGAGTETRALCHTDLGGNLIWDAAARRLGVIDFGDAILSDPVLDLASIAALSDRLASAVTLGANHLRDRSPDADKIRATFALQDALNDARQGDWVAVDETLSDY